MFKQHMQLPVQAYFELPIWGCVKSSYILSSDLHGHQRWYRMYLRDKTRVCTLQNLMDQWISFIGSRLSTATSLSRLTWDVCSCNSFVPMSPVKSVTDIGYFLPHCQQIVAQCQYFWIERIVLENCGQPVMHYQEVQFH